MTNSNVTVRAVLELAGWPEGQIRKVVRTSFIDALLEQGLIEEVPEDDGPHNNDAGGS
jgi:hypothetical protein